MLREIFLGEHIPEEAADADGYWRYEDWRVQQGKAETKVKLLDDSGIDWGEYRVICVRRWVEPQRCPCGRYHQTGEHLRVSMQWIGAAHPHIAPYDGGLCLGQAAVLIRELIESGELTSALAVARDVFEHPNWDSLLIRATDLKADGRGKQHCTTCGAEGWMLTCVSCHQRTCAACAVLCPLNGKRFPVVCSQCARANGHGWASKQLSDWCERQCGGHCCYDSEERLKEVMDGKGKVQVAEVPTGG